MFILTFQSGIAQSVYFEQVKTRQEVTITGDSIKLDMNIDLDDLILGTDQMIVITPMLFSKDKNKEKALPSMIVTGNRKRKTLKRAMKLNEQSSIDFQNIYSIIQRKNGDKQSIYYNIQIPSSDWMKSGELTLKEDFIGCVNCILESYERSLFSPIPNMSLVSNNVPLKSNVELIKKGMVVELRFNYEPNSYEIHSRIADNTDQIQKIELLYSEYLENNNITIDSVKIIGYASPDGLFDKNLKLSKTRAEVTEDFIMTKFKIDKKNVYTKGVGEDWDGLMQLLENSSFEDKEQVIQVIRDINFEQREHAIMRLGKGEIFKKLLKYFYPKLRKTICTIYYTVSVEDNSNVQDNP